MTAGINKKCQYSPFLFSEWYFYKNREKKIMLHKYCLALIVLMSVFSYSTGQSEEDAFFIKRIFETSLSEGSAYEWLDYLSSEIGGRLAGSDASLDAVYYTRDMLEGLEPDSVWLQACTVNLWERGENEIVEIRNSPSVGTKALSALALGNTIGTGEAGLQAEVIEVMGLDELEAIKDEIPGKIVFYNRPMDPALTETFNAYGGAVDQRVFGASRAAGYGAVAALVRSMTNKLDDVPHTGVSIYEDSVVQIPSIAISTNDAEFLSDLLKKETVEVYLRNTSGMEGERESYNVVAEVRGSEFPEEIIVVGGHLDSWDVGGGAHDDGSGCVQSMQVLELFKKLDYRPKRTLRIVMFMNEENGLSGGKEYAALAKANKEYHLAALESDRGGFSPRGFGCSADESIFTERFKALKGFSDVLEPYGLYINNGGGGADIGPLKDQGALLIGLIPDAQRYFDYHHTTADVIEAVNRRELNMGAAAMASLIYMIDKYGL